MASFIATVLLGNAEENNLSWMFIGTDGRLTQSSVSAKMFTDRKECLAAISNMKDRSLLADLGLDDLGGETPIRVRDGQWAAFDLERQLRIGDHVVLANRHMPSAGKVAVIVGSAHYNSIEVQFDGQTFAIPRDEVFVIKTVEQLSLDRFGSSYVNAIADHYRGIEFTDNGLARLNHIAGFIRGLLACGQRDAAERMAYDIDCKLSQLSQYGDKITQKMGTNEDDGSDVTVSYPSHRVVLSDYGTFGGFGIGWFRAIDNEKRLEVAKQIQIAAGVKPEAEAKTQYDCDDYKMDWWDACQEADKKLGVRKSLEQWRYYRFGKGDGHSSYSTLIQYAYSFNGGLLYHGPGGDEVFAMTLGTSDNLWSIHT